MIKVKDAIANQFQLNDMGELKYILVVTVDQKTNPGGIWIGQPGYTERVLQKFNMEDDKPISIPVNTSVKLTKVEEN